MAKKKNEIVVVKDEETGEVIITTEELKKKAIENSEKTRQAKCKTVEGHLELGYLFKENRDEKLYRHLGYKTFPEYAEIEHDISKGYAYAHIEIIEKLPPQFVQLVRQIPLTMHKLTYLISLPEKVLQKVDEEQIREWAELPVKDFKDEVRKTKARYQKIYRKSQRQEEKILTLKAEKEDLLKEIEELGKEVFILKAEEKNEKILRLQQDRENLLNKIKELHDKISEYEKKTYTEEQALAIINKSYTEVLGALLEVQKIKVFPAILPSIWSFYKMCDAFISSQISYLIDEFDPSTGPIALKHIVKDMPEIKGTVFDPNNKEIPPEAKPDTKAK